MLGEGGSPTLSPGTDAGRVCPKALHDAEPTKHTQPFPGKGVFGKDAEIRTRRALSMDAYKRSNKVGAGRTDNKRPLLHRGKAIRVS